MINKMNPEIRDLWCDALESGEYKQCASALTRIAGDGTESHCCLGVLTELGVKAGVTKRLANLEADDEGNIVKYDDGSLGGQGYITPSPVMAWAGLTDSIPDVKTPDGEYGLSGLNDGEGLTFPEIAALIRKSL